MRSRTSWRARRIFPAGFSARAGRAADAAIPPSRAPAVRAVVLTLPGGPAQYRRGTRRHLGGAVPADRVTDHEEALHEAEHGRACAAGLAVAHLVADHLG